MSIITYEISNICDLLLQNKKKIKTWSLPVREHSSVFEDVNTDQPVHLFLGNFCYFYKSQFYFCSPTNSLSHQYLKLTARSSEMVNNFFKKL